VSDEGRIADDESSRRAGIGVAFLHAVYTVYKCWNCPEKAPLCATFRVARGDVNAVGPAPQAAWQSADRH
jgi:hypothetical protein